MHQHLAIVRFLNEIIQHALGDLEVGNYAVLHGLDRHNISGRAAQHLFGLFAHRFHLARVLIDGHDGRFVDHDTLAFREHEGIRCAQIDC